MTETKIKNKKKIMTESLKIINQPDKRVAVWRRLRKKVSSNCVLYLQSEVVLWVWLKLSWYFNKLDSRCVNRRCCQLKQYLLVGACMLLKCCLHVIFLQIVNFKLYLQPKYNKRLRKVDFLLIFTTLICNYYHKEDSGIKKCVCDKLQRT